MKMRRKIHNNIYWSEDEQNQDDDEEKSNWFWILKVMCMERITADVCEKIWIFQLFP